MQDTTLLFWGVSCRFSFKHPNTSKRRDEQPWATSWLVSTEGYIRMGCLFLARIDCYNNLVLLKMGPQLLGAREMSVWSLWSIKQIKRYACTWDMPSMYWILAVPQCFFWQFHGLYSKENPCSGWICQRWFLGYTKEYGHNAMATMPWWSLKIM